MTEKRILKWIGWLVIFIGILIIVFRRIAGIDLTEGQLFIQDLPWWIAAAGCLIGGCAIINNAQGRQPCSQGKPEQRVGFPAAMLC